jgi:hypothetical protein
VDAIVSICDNRLLIELTQQLRPVSPRDKNLFIALNNDPLFNGAKKIAVIKSKSTFCRKKQYCDYVNHNHIFIRKKVPALLRFLTLK